ncbi:PREDICTED: vacuolar protein sorting-associated protein 13C-like [Thamnophis sirtalis]|uniref:Vacuolar protein sorting-associated protein 13C-like n=1 Tax=Thamnophis sirtalis TaxID=35019 RepID=A0A6I9XI92_9SAUR|nr:PREDICTED: vacuolar protein sorting-associated protein 13C-like [Thamnophis sirtalis]
MTGLRQRDVVPSLVASIGAAESSLLEIQFETNPEGSVADQSLFLQSQPVEIIYDARTINALVEFFQTNRGMDLERLTTATLSKLEEIKERTSTGLMHIIETRKVLDLRINLKPSYLLIPQTGFHHEKSNLLILDLGTFQLKSISQGHHQNSSSSLEEIMDKAYDRFDVEIKNVQLLFGRSGEDWKKARSEPASLLHILRPMDIRVQVAKSMVEKDVRMAKFKVSGELPLVHLRISDQKIKGVLELIDSIPLPQKSSVSVSTAKAPAIPVVSEGRKDFLGATRLLEELEPESDDEYFDFDDYPQQPEKVVPPTKKQLKNEIETVQEELTDLQLKFEIKEVILELTKQLQREETILVFNVQQLGMEATARTFDLKAETYLRKISLNYYEIQGKRQQIHLISSSDVSGLDLLKVEYIKADKNGPKFQTVFDNTEQRMEVTFSSLQVVLHTQALLSALGYLMAVVPAREKQPPALQRREETQRTESTWKEGKVKEPVPSAGAPKSSLSEEAQKDDKTSLLLNFEINKVLVTLTKQVEKQSFPLYRLTNFLSNFQIATEALSAATVQAAEKAATSMRDFAQRSFRLAMDINLKAPVIVVPQSSVSCNAVVFDLGLIKIQNRFSLVPAEDCSLPPIVDKMEVHLTQLKLSRTVLQRGASQPDIQILRPINLDLSVNRNLAGMWYHKIPLVEVQGYLDTISPGGLHQAYETSIYYSKGDPLNIISSSDESGKHLLKMEYVKADVDGPHFDTVYNRTKQLLNVSFSSLDLILHTEALLSIMNFFTSASSGITPAEKGADVERPSEDPKTAVAKSGIGGLISLFIEPRWHSLSTRSPFICRAVVGSSPQPEIEILQPVNLQLSVQRNLASDWYLQIPGISIQGDLKAMLLSLSQDDLTLLMNILLENLSEAAADPKATSSTLPDVQKPKKPEAAAVAGLGEGTPEIPAEEVLGGDQLVKSVAVMFHFNFESLSLVLYNADKNQKPQLHNSHLRLGELGLHFMRSSGQMFSDGSLDVSTKMETCTLDDLREGVEKATARMLARRDGKAESVMIDIRYKQDKNGADIVAVLDQLYLCASMEFLLTVADFFIQSMPAAGAAEKPAQLALKASSQGKPRPEKAAAAPSNMSVVAHILDPEIVFVANLTKADAPALAASFQGSFMLSGGSEAKHMTARVLDLRVLACPFLRGAAKQNVTTVVQPCSLIVEATMDTSGVQSVDVNMETLVVKVSPIILNTVMTILAAMKRQAKEEESGGTPCNPVDLWSVKSVDECQSWFLGVDMATEATEALVASEQREKKEHFVVVVKSVQVTLECGLGHRTVPLLLAESAFSGTVKNWSSLMSAQADVTLEKPQLHNSHLRLGELGLHFMRSSGQMFSDGSLDVSTKMETCTLDDLREGVEKATARMLARRDGKAESVMIDIRYKQDKNGADIVAVLDQLYLCASMEFLLTVADFFIQSMPAAGAAEKPAQLALKASSQGKPRPEKETKGKGQHERKLFWCKTGPEGYSEVSGVPIAKPGRRLHAVRAPQSSSSNSVVVQIDAEEGNKVITLRSPLQIKNHFSVPFIIYKFVKDIKQLRPLGVSLPEEEFHVPLDSYRCQLFVQPTGVLKGQYEPSTTYISWQEELHRSSEVTCMLQCPAADARFLPLRLKATAVPDELNFIATHKENWEPAYIIHFYPTLTLQNLLPYSLQYILEGTAKAHELHEGSAADVLHSRISGEVMELIVVKYQGRDWSGRFRVHDALPEFFPVCFTSHSAEGATLDVYLHVKKSSTHTTLSVYSPYWIINKTSRILQYRAEDVHVKHPADFRDTVLFSFKKKNIFSKNKIQLCISTSTWSNGFSLDTVGNSGCVKCPAGNMDFLCVAFWPESPSGKLCIRASGSEQFSKPFFYNRQDNGTLLSLEKMNTGVLVNVSLAEHSIVINVSDYYEGAAPALVINQTSWATLKYQQSGLQEVMELKPKEVRLFVWEDPTGMRKLSWNYAQNTGELDLLKDECGQFPYNANTPIHWVSFLDGRQRVLLFTEDVALVSKARQAEEMEQPDQEINIALQGLGLSLVNNTRKQEISYIGITSSGIVWELKPKQRWKPFNQKHINLLEQVYQRRISAQSTEPSGWIKINNNFEINFDKVPMEMRLPFRCIIKRDFLSAIQIEFKQSAHQKSLRAQLYWLQVDNQLPGSMFPVVFHPVAPPKSIALDSGEMNFKHQLTHKLRGTQPWLAFFEIRYQFYKRNELLWRVIGHYRGQFLKQMYILVLGLDVLGNPFGLIRGLSEGVEALFYEPFQGAVQGPEEFAEGFVIGVRSLLGHTVGGAAGVVSRITGSVGKGLAAITMDKEFQQKRREEMGRQPRDFGDSLAKGGKGFLRGVVGGVTGMVTKPVEGAKKEGAAGFFKGIGKGLVGVVARPTGGIIDMASSTFQGIQRVAESTEEVSSLRPPRLIREDGIIRPYDRGEAEGCDLFENSHIKKLEDESFQHYCPVVGRGKAYIVVTSRRVILMKEVEILGHMTTDWDYLYEDFTRPPWTEENLLQIFVKDKGMLCFHKKETSGQELIRKIRLPDAAAAKRTCQAIDAAEGSRHQQTLVKQASLKRSTSRT